MALFSSKPTTRLMLLLLPTLSLGLRIPVIFSRSYHLPLDTTLLTLDESEYRELSVTGTGRSLIGLVQTTRHETSAPQGACGVLCEARDAGSLEDEGLFVVRATAFSRFRITAAADAFAPVPIFDVDPVLDAQPEDDAALARHELSARRGALRGLEMRAHLLYSGVLQLLGWSGTSVAASATVGRLAPAERAEFYRAVERFAPLASEVRAAPPDECLLDDEHFDDGRLDDEADDEAEGEAQATWACELERAYLHACVEPPCSYRVGGRGPSGRLDARDLSDFQLPRAELYSFALSRLFDASPKDVEEMLRGRSTAARLVAAEEQLAATHAWLSTRLGIPAAGSEPAPRGGGALARAARSGGGPPRGLSGPALRTRWRRMLRAATGADRPPAEARRRPRQQTAPPRDGWEAMEDGVF